MSKVSKNPIIRTNREFLGYIDKTTSHIYMISEFIDNSIQSARDKKLNHVKVKIIVNLKEEAIYIIDNAAGIAYKNRGIAIKNGKDESEQGDNLNMFGVGMKMASIWFGRRLRIYTKSIEDDFAYMINLDIDKLKGDDFHFEDKKDIDVQGESGIEFGYDHGTIIKIDKLHLKTVHKGRYDKKYFNRGSKQEGKSLQDQLACRYSRYIKRGYLSISLSFLNSKGYEELDGNVPVQITESSIPSIYIGKLNSRNDYEFYKSKNEKVNINESNYYNREVEKLKNKYKLNWNSNIDGLENITYGDIITKFENQEDLKYTTYIKMDQEKYGGEKVKFTFGFIGKNDALLKYNGLSVYQDDRAIISGPNTKHNILTWLAYDKSLSGSSFMVNKRFVGELDLENKSIFRVDNNKIGFHGDVKEDVETLISDIFKKNLSNLFAKILEIIFFKDEQAKEDANLREEVERFANEINKNEILDKIKVNAEAIEQINENDGDRTRHCFSVVDENNLNLFKIVCNPNNEFGNKMKLFKTSLNTLSNGCALFVLNVNKEFYGFKTGISDEHFSVLLNPLIKLLICQLSKYEDNNKRYEVFSKIIEGFENE